MGKRRTIFVCGAAAALVGLLGVSRRTDASAYTAAVLADNPSAYWRLDDASGTTAVATVGTNGTYSGGSPTFSLSGATGDGDTSVRWPGDGSHMTGPFSATASFSVEAWAKAAMVNWNEYGWIASDREANGFIIHPDQNTKTVDFYVFKSDGSFAGPVTVTPADVSIFHQYVGTYDNTTGIASIYMDGGALSHSANIGAGLRSTSSNRVLIGNDDIAGRNGNGSSDDVSIYPTVLTQAQVLAHFQAATVPEPGALGMIAVAGAFICRRRRVESLPRE